MANCETRMTLRRDCKDCGESKNLVECFYKSKKLASGEQGYRAVCKNCCSAKVDSKTAAKHSRTYYYNNREKMLQRVAIYYNEKKSKKETDEAYSLLKKIF
jgi:hypothetical protein